MKITRSFKTPISRIIDEGIRINNRDKNTLLNSKSEHFGPSVKRKVLENVTECPKCKYRCRSEYSLKNHLKTHTTNTKLSCVKCEDTFSSVSDLQKHNNSVHKDKDFKCNVCQVTLDSLCDLKEHVKSAHKRGSYSCEKCSDKFNSISDLKNHLMTHTTDKNMVAYFVENVSRQ